MDDIKGWSQIETPKRNRLEYVKIDLGPAVDDAGYPMMMIML